MKPNSDKLFFFRRAKVYHQNDDYLSIIITTNSERIRIAINAKKLISQNFNRQLLKKISSKKRKGSHPDKEFWYTIIIIKNDVESSFEMTVK